MGPKRPEKRAKKEGGNRFIRRIGVTWRKDPTKCVVEMRPPNWKWKLNFGSYDTEEEAMVARDYGAHLRASARENIADAGGFGTNHKLYQFEESFEIFESMEETKVRCGEVRPLYQQLVKEKWSGDGNPPHHDFCKAARKDIAVAIKNFRKRFPDTLLTYLPADTEDDVPKVEPVDSGIYSAPSSSNPGVRFAPELAPEAITASVWNGWSDMPVQIAIAVNGSPFQTKLDMKVLLLHEEQVRRIIHGCIDKIREELLNSSFEKVLEQLEPCSVDPVSIPAIDVPESKT